jgi:hypothetical protein
VRLSAFLRLRGGATFPFTAVGVLVLRDGNLMIPPMSVSVTFPFLDNFGKAVKA